MHVTGHLHERSLRYTAFGSHAIHLYVGLAGKETFETPQTLVAELGGIFSRRREVRTR